MPALPVLLRTGTHAARPAASAVGIGGLYSCTTHGIIYQTSGSAWTTWATGGGGGGAAVPSAVTSAGRIYAYKNFS